ncbi:hypothetical protein [Chryseobacterium sp.]|uniref:hypothetical protein n=1 Tax=Chryseobacterium sp. TaxID=1871047 RepID=UPI003341AB5D
MLDIDLIDREIDYVTINGTKFFNVKDIKEKAKDIFVQGKQTVKINDTIYILAENLRLKTEFDYMIEKALKFNPNKNDEKKDY